MLSVVKSKQVDYHKHVNTVAADVVASNTQAERSRAQVKVLSGFDKLCRDMLHNGFNLVRIQAKNAQDLKDSFMWVEDPEMHNIVENRKNKIINEFGASLGTMRELGTIGFGPSRQGDVFNPNSPFNFGNTRARHSVESKPEDLQHIMLLSIAWGEYMSFTQSGESIGYASQVHTLQQQKKAGMAALQDALTSAQPCLSTAQDKAVKLATLDSKLEHLHQAFQSLLQDAKPFIQARLKDLKAHVKFESEQDIHAEREFHVTPESLPPVHLDIQVDGERETVTLMNLSPTEYEVMFDAMGINDIEGALNSFYTDSPNKKNATPLLKNGESVEVDDSTRPFLKAVMRFDNEGITMLRSGWLSAQRAAMGIDNDEEETERDMNL
ncbi:MAG: hypothetical protein Q9N67_05555 [Ghiorsea sp.]|nr:hypothetical protein [Ghiorsea sp.]